MSTTRRTRAVVAAAVAAWVVLFLAAGSAAPADRTLGSDTRGAPARAAATGSHTTTAHDAVVDGGTRAKLGQHRDTATWLTVVAAFVLSTAAWALHRRRPVPHLVRLGRQLRLRGPPLLPAA